MVTISLDPTVTLDLFSGRLTSQSVGHQFGVRPYD